MLNKKDIQNLILKFRCKKDLCKHLNISIYKLNKLLINFNLKYPRISPRKGIEDLSRRIRPDIHKQWLIDNWVNTNKSIHQLAVENNISESILDWRRSKYKLIKKFKHQLDTSKLYDLSDPHLYYLVGLTATDGYIPKNSNAIELRLSGESELDLLTAIKIYYNSSFDIKKYGKTYSLRLSANGLNKFLIDNFNLLDGPKTFSVNPRCNFPSENCIKAYLLGCFDGDGYISKKRYCCSLCTASEIFIKHLIDIINYHVNLNIKINYTQRNNKLYPYLSLNGNTAKKFLDWIYSIDDCFKLQRKYENYLKLKI